MTPIGVIVSEIIRNAGGKRRFMSEDEMFDDMKRRLDSEDRKIIASDFLAPMGANHTTRVSYLSVKVAFQRAIRNEYRLWEPDNPYTDPLGTTTHPDAVSARVYQRLVEWARS